MRQITIKNVTYNIANKVDGQIDKRQICTGTLEKKGLYSGTIEILDDLNLDTIIIIEIDGIDTVSYFSNGKALIDYKIYGKTTPNGGVGDLVVSGEHQGSYQIPIVVESSGQSTTKNIYLSEPLHGATVYGIHLTPGESEYNIEYLENAVGKTPAGMNFSTGIFDYGDWANVFFMPRPCMLKYDGTVDYYLDPNNYNLKDGVVDPTGYRFVEYIESNGTQYIDTDIMVTDYTNMSIDMVFKPGARVSTESSTVHLFGTSDGGSIAYTLNYGADNYSSLYFWCGYDSSASFPSISAPFGEKHYAHLEYKNMKIDTSINTNAPSTPTASTVPASPIRLFGAAGAISYIYAASTLRLYSFTVNEKINGTFVVTHNLIPAEKQDSNHTLGMYDIITDTFYPNNGTGTFLKGEYGVNSDVDNVNYAGNTMMEWSKIWYKFAPGTVDGEGYFYVSDQKIDDSYHCWCNLDCNGSEIPHFYTPIYSCVQYDGKMRSICGFKQSTIAYSYYLKDYATYASANNTTSNKEWYIETFCDRQLIDALLMLIGKTTKFQTVYGKGILESNAYHYTGDANDKGLFYGASTNNQALKIFGMEDWWGTRYRFLAGAMTIENTTDYMMQLLYKLTWSDLDGSTTTGYQEENYTNSSGYLTMGYKQVSLAQGSTDWKLFSKYFIFTNDLYRPYITDDSNLSDLVEMGFLFSGTARNQGFSIGGGQINNRGDQYPFTIYSQDMNITTYRPNIVYRNGNISCKPLATNSTSAQTLTVNADYIDYTTQKRYNSDGTSENVTLPQIIPYEGNNTLSINTTVKPSKISVKGEIQTI